MSPLLSSAASNEVFVFGSGDCGQLGLGEDVWSEERPARHPFFVDKDIVQVAAGGLHSLALSSDGRVWSWGCNDEKALGHEEPEFTVGLVKGLEGVAVRQIACGDSISAALAEDGSVWTWGTFRDSKGILGHSLESSLSVRGKRPKAAAPSAGSSRTFGDYQERPCRLQSLERVVQISAGANHLMALTADGAVYAWGAGEQGQLGRRILERHKRDSALRPSNVTPRAGRSAAVIGRIACGAYHTLCLTQDQQNVFASGLNNHGQLGLGEGDIRERLTAELISQQTWQGHRIVQLSAGEHHSLALTDSGHVLSFGRNDSGQCGIPNAGEQIFSPRVIPTLSNITMIASGSNHNLAADVGGTVYSWGFGEMHQLGHGIDSDAQAPTPIATLSGRRVLQLSAGGQHSIVLLQSSNTNNDPAAI